MERPQKSWIEPGAVGTTQALLASRRLRELPDDVLRVVLARWEAAAEHLLAEFIAGLHLLGSSGVASPSVAVAPLRSDPAERHDTASRYAFKREGDYWTLVADGRLSRLRSLRGLEFVAELLRHPYEPIYVVDLAGLGIAAEGRLSVEEATEHGLRVSAESDTVPALDRRAREDYRARWRELLVEEAEARHDNDVGRAARIQREIDMLAEQLAAVAGDDGCGRSGPSVKERARVNVRNCITKALRAIRHHDERLWRHLSNSIKTGTFCCYAPDRPVVWDM